MNNLLILGAGGHGQVVKETVELNGKFNRIEFLDDNSPLALDSMESFVSYKDNFTHAFVAIGNNEIREQFINKLKASGFIIPTLIHPTAFVSPSSTIDDGCYIGAMAVINANVNVGSGCIFGIGSLVDYDSTIRAFSYVKAKQLVEAGSIYV